MQTEFLRGGKFPRSGMHNDSAWFRGGFNPPAPLNTHTQAQIFKL